MGRVLARGDSTWEVGAGQGLIRWRTNRRARVFCSSERQRHNVARHDEGVAGPDPPLQAGRTHLDSSATVFIMSRTADVIVVMNGLTMTGCSGGAGGATGSADEMYRPRRRGARAALRTGGRAQAASHDRLAHQQQNALRTQGGLGSELRLRFNPNSKR